MKKEQGFTLIEFLVVIAIIGILAGILFVAINPKKQTDNAKESAILAGLAQIPTLVANQNASDYTGVCDDANKAKKVFNAVIVQANDSSPICNSKQDSYAMSVKFNNNGIEEKYCLDVTGVHQGVEADTVEGANGKFDCVSGD